MLELTEGNIRAITETIDKAEITFSHLREDLIDHICCEIENMMQHGLDFQHAFEKTKKSFGIKDLQRVQEQTMLLIDKNYCIMKKTMKVSGVLSTSLLVIASLFKIQHWPGASLMLVLGFFILCFLFMPSANFVMHREKKDRRMIFLFLSGFLGSVGFFLGILFKVMHWPGAGILLIFGLGFLGIVFLPTLFVFFMKNAKNNIEKIIYSVGIIGGIFYLVGFLFKIMQWPVAVVLLIIGSVLLVGVFMPILTVYRYKNEKYIKGSFIYLIVAISYFILFSILISINVSRSIIDVMVDQNLSAQKITLIIEDQNSMISEISENTENYKTILEVKSASNYLYNFMEEVKVDIVKSLGGDNMLAIKNENSIDVTKIIDYTNVTSPFFILIREDHKGKAFLIKEMIEDTRKQWINAVNHNNSISPLIETLLSTSLPNESPEWAKSWEMLYFNHTSVISAMNVLTNLQRNVRLAEKETIGYLINHSLNK